MNTKRTLIVVASFIALQLAIASPARALPAFAKKWGLSCASCHNAWPMLNAFGRNFKENGYKLDLDTELGDEDHIKAEDLALYKFTPFSGRIKGYVADKRKDGVTKVRPFHELEAYFAGNAGEKVSYFIEVEAEDEADWNVFAEIGMVGVHPMREFNVSVGLARVFWVDPYQTFAEAGRRLTRAHKEFASQRYGSRQRLRSGNNQLTAWGRLGGRVFYAAGVGTGTGDPEGEDPKDFTGRIAFDVLENFMVGGFYWGGDYETAEDGRLGFSRAGFDFQYQAENVSVFGTYLSASDDQAIGASSVSNNAFSFTGLATPRLGGKNRTTFMPLVRIDTYTRDDGNDRFTDGTFNFTYYVLDNLGVSLEFWTNLSVPDDRSKSNRTTLLFNMTF